jgi:hypothetical protein
MNTVAKIEHEQPAPVSETAALISIIERAASNPAVDVDKMMKLLEMRERIQGEEARKAFNAAMSAAQAEMPAVVRNAKNDQTKSKYATLEAIADAIQPIITKHGFGLSYGTDDCPKEGYYRVTCDVTHEAGGEKKYHADIPIDGSGMKGNANKTATHAFGSTMSYGRRYLKLMIFDIATKDDDDGNKAGKSEETLSDEQIGTIVELLDSYSIPREQFLKILHVESLADVYANRFDDVVRLIHQRGRK